MRSKSADYWHGFRPTWPVDRGVGAVLTRRPQCLAGIHADDADPFRSRSHIEFPELVDKLSKWTVESLPTSWPWSTTERHSQLHRRRSLSLNPLYRCRSRTSKPMSEHAFHPDRPPSGSLAAFIAAVARRTSKPTVGARRVFTRFRPRRSSSPRSPPQPSRASPTSSSPGSATGSGSPRPVQPCSSRPDKSCATSRPDEPPWRRSPDCCRGRCPWPACRHWPPTRWLAWWEIRQHHEGVRVDLAAPEDSEDLFDLVESGACELGLTDAADVPQSLAAISLGTQKLVFILPPGSTPAGEDPLGALDRGEIPLVVAPVGASTRRLLDQQFGALGRQPTLAVVSAQREAILPLVVAGAGAALVPEAMALIAENLGAVVARPTPPAVRDLVLVHRLGPLSPAASRFVELAAGQIPTPSPVQFAGVANRSGPLA